MSKATVDVFLKLVSDGALTGNFATSLFEQFQRKGSLSEKQEFWACKLAREALTPPIEAPAIEFEGILSIFKKAAPKLKHPKITLRVDGKKLRLSRAGDRSRRPGTINVTDGRPFGENEWYGRIDLDGKFEPSRQCSKGVIELLQKLDKDPAGVATAYGQETGNCCFCSKGLTDKRSVTVGYGPTCAGNYGLPWGA